MLTIITVSRDAGLPFQKTIESISNQIDQNFQLIICSPEIDLKLPPQLQLKATILRDIGVGIYAAMNQCITAAATGHIIFLNAGDLFASPIATEVINSKNGVKRPLKAQVIVAGYGLKWLLPETAASHQSCVFYHEATRPIFYDSAKSVYADGEYIERHFSCIEPIYIRRPMVMFALGGISSNYNFSLFALAYRECGAVEALKVLMKVIMQAAIGAKALRSLIYGLKGIKRYRAD